MLLFYTYKAQAHIVMGSDTTDGGCLCSRHLSISVSLHSHVCLRGCGMGMRAAQHRLEGW